MIQFVTVQQVRSSIRKPKKQRETLIGLGLNKMYSYSRLQDTPSVRGMINAVSHLVRVIDELPSKIEE